MTDSILWLRLITSAHMREHSSEFEPYCVDGNADSFEHFLRSNVEKLGVEADEMQASQALAFSSSLLLPP